jgi:hypothetical protein
MPHNSDVIGITEAAVLIVKGTVIYTAIAIAIIAAVQFTIGIGTVTEMPYGVI